MRIFVQHEPPTDAELAIQVIHAVLGCAENGDVLVPSNCVPSALSRLSHHTRGSLSKDEPRGPVLSRPVRFI